MPSRTHAEIVDDILDEVQRGWLHRLDEAKRAILAEHLEGLAPGERARVIHRHGDGIAEREIDEVWTALKRRPTAEEYRALAVLMQEAARYCEREAESAAHHPTEAP